MDESGLEVDTDKAAPQDLTSASRMNSPFPLPALPPFRPEPYSDL
jgi:hypothetical protein